MTVSTATQHQVAQRRQRVASLRARGLTLDEIWIQISQPYVGGNPNPSYMPNPDTGQPFDRSTVQRDLQAIHKVALEAIQQSGLDIKARVQAELDELRRAAWSAKRYDLVLRCLEREAKLYGLDAPTSIDLTTGGQPLKTYISLEPGQAFGPDMWPDAPQAVPNGDTPAADE